MDTHALALLRGRSERYPEKYAAAGTATLERAMSLMPGRSATEPRIWRGIGGCSCRENRTGHGTLSQEEEK